ncbi:aminotransferase class I/II-fold pyridoxal phosphate-dependent enzyme [Sphingomonas qomolangmaensis]|uniref:Aminotransferase n=1 Tax=Sphingomonas qomolangmaensis TaxID=2918765 RepID=A0ABY5LA57_9SPHN|nr:aminotransferase class I/II-fold pyridoxal phosphate-dependent enzyme [Sphingomonas qomolangmaensis]UUL82841.1 aminotransferase class I/II-fold pyridoxal phosphate-dependent enzyme [Sphingomonas qomolangmaensis]
MAQAARIAIAPPDIARFAVHGGRIDAARAAYSAVADWIDLSTGLSPWAWPATIDASALTHLPTPDALATLEATAAAAFGTSAAGVVAVPGSDLALRLLGRMIGGHAAVAGPGYSGHVAMWAGRAVAAGLGSLADSARTGETVVVARPNNPDGHVVDIATLERLAERDDWLIVDEAFVDATPELSLAGQAWDSLIVLRSFGKFYGLAGLRLGFVIAPPAIVQGLRELLGDWPVSGPAIAIGTAAYADRDWAAMQVARVTEAAARLDGLFAGAGLRVAGGTALFRLVETPHAHALFDHLAQRGILTRPFADRPQALRLGLPGTPAAWDRIDTALNDWSKP